MATHIIYVDPTDGDDTNTGTTENSAVKTLVKGFELLLSGAVSSDADYDIITFSGVTDDEYTLRLVKDTIVITKGIKLAISNVSEPIINIRGKGNACIEYSNPRTDLFYVWLFTGGSDRFRSYNRNFRVINSAPSNQIRFVGMYNSDSILELRNMSFTDIEYGGVALSSGEYGYCYFVAGGPSAATPFLNFGTSLTSNCAYNGDTYEDNRTTFPTATKTIAGDGCFLPPPNEDYDFDPSMIDFVADGWIDDSTFTNGRPHIESSFISIDSGTQCRVLGPVMYYPDKIKFSSMHMEASEDETPAPGDKDVIDSTPSDSIRTVEVRYSDTAFNQTDSSPAWNTIERDSEFTTIEAKYIQFRITLISDGV